MNQLIGKLSWLALALACALPVSAQTPPPTNQPDPQELKLLRETLAEQARNPGKIIRTFTNLPPNQTTQTNQANQTAQAQLTSPAPAPPIAVPVYKPEPPRTETPSATAAAAAALERQFLDGKLSERQYRKALAELESGKTPSKETASKVKPTPSSTAVPPKGASRVSTNEPVAQPTARQQKVSEVESRIDEMIRQKEARERAAQTNSTVAPTGPMTKRQRLDFLLKQVVEGKLSDEQYKKERDKILTEPD